MYKTEKSAGGIVYKKEHEKTVWLITQHSVNKGWGFPKGLIGDKIRNEPPEIAALREVREEGGVEATILNSIPIEVRYMYRLGHYLINKTVWYYLMKYNRGNPQDHDEEMSDAEFVDEKEVRHRLTYRGDKDAFTKALAMMTG